MIVNFHFSTLRAVCIDNFMLLVEISHSKKKLKDKTISNYCVFMKLTSEGTLACPPKTIRGSGFSRFAFLLGKEHKF